MKFNAIYSDPVKLHPEVTQKVNVPGGAMGIVTPKRKQHRTFEHELIGKSGPAQPIKQTLQAITGQNEIKIFTSFFR